MLWPSFNCSNSTMSDSKKMSVQGAYLMVVSMFVAATRGAGAVVIHASADLGGEHTEFLQMLFKQMDTLVTSEQQENKAISQVDSEAVSTLLQVAPSVTIKGNLTDHERRLTITFTVQASRSHHSAAAAAALEADDGDDDDDDEEEDGEWRSSSGVLTPIVDVVEPYLLGFVELVVNGILSTLISNFLEGSNLLGDVRLV